MTAKERLIKLAQNNLDNVKDNLYRAQRNALCMDSTKPYGQSGRTLDEIIREYKKHAKEALETLAEAQKSSGLMPGGEEKKPRIKLIEQLRDDIDIIRVDGRSWQDVDTQIDAVCVVIDKLLDSLLRNEI